MQRACGCAVAISCGVLAACGGGGSNGDSADSGYDPAAARLVGGVEGVRFSSQGQAVSDSQTGTTDEAGKFTLSIYGESGGCPADPNSIFQSCETGGALPTFGTTALAIGSAVIPNLQGPTQESFDQTPAYTAYDLFPTKIEAENWQTVVLMGNVNSGDPTKAMGIKISPALQKATSITVNWAALNIQQEAAPLQTIAKSDGLAHDWPTGQQARATATSSCTCARDRECTQDLQQSTTTNGAGKLGGNFAAVVGFDGQVNGIFDFSLWAATPYTQSVPFSGSVTINEHRRSGNRELHR